MDYFFDVAVAIILSTIKAAFKNPSSAEKLKKVLLKIRNQITLLYANDEEFRGKAEDFDQLNAIQ